MIDHSLIMAAISKFRGKRIMCIGDVMLDRYVNGDVHRISPEAPIPILSTSSESCCLGAAGNVARNIASLGATVEFHSAVGDDYAGIQIKGLLEKEVNIESYIQTHNGNTTVKTRYISQGQQILRVDQEKIIWDSVSDHHIGKADAVILSDYQKGVVSGKYATAIIKESRASGIPVVVDSKARVLTQFRGATVITPNLSELAGAVNWFSPSDNDRKIIDAARSVISCDGIRNVLVTRSSKGMTLVTENDGITYIPATAKEVYDVVGAGDTVTAVLALGLACGLSMENASYLANIAGGIVVGKRGTAIVTPMELKTSLLALMDKPLKDDEDYSNIPEFQQIPLVGGTLLGQLADA